MNGRQMLSNEKRKVRIVSQGKYIPKDPKDPYNIQREYQLQKQPLYKKTHDFKTYFTKNQKRYFNEEESNQKHEENQIEKNREQRSTSEINKISEQRNLNQSLPTQTKSRSISTQNKKIVITEIKNNYFDQQKQNNLLNQEVVTKPKNHCSQQQLNTKLTLQNNHQQQELFLTKWSLTDRQKQQDNEQSLTSINQSCLDFLQQSQLIKKEDLKAQSRKEQNRNLCQLGVIVINQTTYQNRVQATPIINECHFCQNTYKMYLNSLSCNHKFHVQCLQMIMENQLKDNSPIIKCICQVQIPQNIVRQYLNPALLSIYYQVQVQYLPKFNKQLQKWKKCPNYGCDFLFLEIPISSRGTQIICPNCIGQILGQSMGFHQL